LVIKITLYEDEAHRATGNYAYVNIIKKLEETFFGYRIVGLSATPGNDL
jgi:ATP-dependent DNA helicase MPH1